MREHLFHNKAKNPDCEEKRWRFSRTMCKMSVQTMTAHSPRSSDKGMFALCMFVHVFYCGDIPLVKNPLGRPPEVKGEQIPVA